MPGSAPDSGSTASPTRTPRHALQPRNFSLSTHRDRFEVVRPYVAGRSVLDIGAGTGQHRDDWMHRLVAEVASEVVGVELSPDLVEQANAKGFDIRLANAETVDLGRTFEVVLAGEVIEHLSNPGLFLDNMRRHLAPGGVLVLTTPNAFAVSNFVYRSWGEVRMNQDHMCWYCADTLTQLLLRHGFDAEVSYIGHQTPGSVRRVLAKVVRAPLPPRLAENTMLVLARPRPDA